ncbi:MAG: serine/threonine protein kinase, partial [Deltaproteobacteria bacterium]|nr:serine/threonine protein kinase [Deltaproteobacteria bacterium]MBW2531247.1 serine/threonine protein kinase [Deltaproteobacteria bacterium]
MDLAPGTMVTSNVRLLRPLREGGMGLVWIAEHLTLKTQVAVKFVSEDLLAAEPDLGTRFQNEASLAAQIKSEHVVHTYDQGVMEDGTPYIVMELLEGSTLTDWVELMGALDLTSVVLLVTQLGKALQRAHRKGIIHRDIKSDNIFLVDTEESEDVLFAKILDFGIAKHTKLPELDMGTKPGTIVGTPEFMSPEQMLAEGPVDERSDLWALAIVAYYALTGHVPFEGKTLVKLCLAVLDGSFPPPSTHVSTIPPEVDRWFEEALAREPEDRFASVRDMAMALQQAAGQRPQSMSSGPGLAEPSHSGGWPAVDDEPSTPGAPEVSGAAVPLARPELAPPGHKTFAGAS